MIFAFSTAVCTRRSYIISQQYFKKLCKKIVFDWYDQYGKKMVITQEPVVYIKIDESFDKFLSERKQLPEKKSQLSFWLFYGKCPYHKKAFHWFTMDWFLHDGDLHHEKVNCRSELITTLWNLAIKIDVLQQSYLLMIAFLRPFRSK